MNDVYEEPNWSYGLDTHAANVLNNAGIRSMAAAWDAFKSGRLKPESREAPRGYGWKAHESVMVWLKQPKPEKPKPSIPNWATCPKCGYCKGKEQ